MEKEKLFGELFKWLKSLQRFGNLKDYFIKDYKDEYLFITFFTKDNEYRIMAQLPTADNDKGYLGGSVKSRKPRAGEDWHRGNDLSDGGYNKETWLSIVTDIVSYELVRVANNSKKNLLVGNLPISNETS